MTMHVSYMGNVSLSLRLNEVCGSWVGTTSRWEAHPNLQRFLQVSHR